MAHRTIRPAMIAAVTVAAIASVALSACGSTSKQSTSKQRPSTTSAATTTAASSNGITTVPVTLSEYKIQPAVTSVAAGPVDFVVTNDGKVKHQLTIIRTDKSAATVLSQQNPDDDIPGARGEISSIAPGATKKLDIKNLKPGHYALVCALPGHYQAGMHVDFTVN